MNYYNVCYGSPDASAVALEDSIMHRGKPVTAGSKMLERFIAPFDASVVTRLLAGNIPLAGKTAMAEFGIYLAGEGCGSAPAGLPYGIPAAVMAVADSAAGSALCNDVFGQYRYAAANNGLCYIHPTYGTVPRYGLIPLVSSMDQIGLVCKDPGRGFELLSIIAGSDASDGAMFPEKTYRYAKTGKKPVVAVLDACDSPALKKFAGRFDTVTIHLEYFEACKQVMQILSCAELSCNISRYDGVKFGYRAEGCKNLDSLYLASRTGGFGAETKLAAIIGSMVLSEGFYGPFYEKAMKIRGLVKKSLRFDNYDVIALPADQNPFDNPAAYSLAQLAGLPSVSFSYQGTGVQLLGNVKDESALFAAWEAVQ